MKRFLIALVFLLIGNTAYAQMPGIATNVHQTYKPPLAAPGIPCGPVRVNCDFITGRTSSNPLKKGFITDGPPIVGISSTSVTVGLGVKVFTVDLSKDYFGTNDSVIFASAADPTNQQMTGSVTSLVGTTLTVNVTAKVGSATASDWNEIFHLPGGWFPSGGAIRARTADAVDWDFRGITQNFRLDGATFILISQSLVNACGLTNPDINVALFDNRSAASFSMTNTEIDGCNYTGRFATIGGNTTSPCPITFQYNKLHRLPGDIISGCVGIAATTFSHSYNYLQTSCTTLLSFGQHTDGWQMTAWQAGDLEIKNNVVSLSCLNNLTGSTVTAPFNITVTAAFAGTVNVHENIAYGGSKTNYAVTPVCPCPAGAMIFRNIYIAYTLFPTSIYYDGGFLYEGGPGAVNAAYPNLTVTNIFNAFTGRPLNFIWNDAGTQKTVFHIP